jgi:hypothetical protein
MNKISLWAILLMLFPNMARGESNSEELLFIANSVPQQTMSLQSAKDFFLGKRTLWPNGNAVKIVIPGRKYPFAEVVARSIYNTSPNGMKKFWLSLVFQGRVKPPILLKSAKAIIEFVAEHEGTIGVVPTNSENIPSELILRIQKK